MPAKKVRGFTLIEVLVAFTILALTLVVIFRLIAGNLSQERIIQQANSRVLEARSLFDRLGRDISLNEGVVQGTSSTGEA